MGTETSHLTLKVRRMAVRPSYAGRRLLTTQEHLSSRSSALQDLRVG